MPETDDEDAARIVRATLAVDEAALALTRQRLEARVQAWKACWGYQPPQPPAKRLAAALDRHMENRWMVDRTAAGDQLTLAFSAQRRHQLRAAVGDSYLAAQHGLRAARDVRPLDDQRGIRADHPASTDYMRDNLETPDALYAPLLQKTDIPAGRHRDLLFVNSPTAIDKMRILYGDRLFPPSQCPPPNCHYGHPAPGSRTQARPLRYEQPGTSCRRCYADLLPYPRVVELATGIHAVLTEFNGHSRFPKDGPTGVSPGLGDYDNEKSVLKAVLRGFGATPSTYQALKAANQGHDTLRLLDHPLESQATLQRIAGGARHHFAAIGPQHAMRVISDATVGLLAGLGDVMAGPSLLGLPSDESDRFRLQRSRLDALVESCRDARRMADMAPQWDRLDALLAQADALAEAAGRDGAARRQADTALKAAQALGSRLRRERMDRDPLLANALGQLQQLMQVMPAMAGDMPRFTKLFDLITDELHIILSITRPYDEAAFQEIFRSQLRRRAPSLARLGDAVDVMPHMVSSGMDAISTGVVAAGLAVGDAASVVDRNSCYYETHNLLVHAGQLNHHGRVIIGGLGSSLPANVPGDVANMVAQVVEKLEHSDTADLQFALVVDVTVETVVPGMPSGIDRLLADPRIAGALVSGRLCVTLCKSFQKYAGLGSGKVMAGSITTIAAKGEFPESDAFLESVDRQQAYMQTDECQLMAHMVATAGEQEIALAAAATRNAERLAALLMGGPDDSIATFNPGLPFVLVTDAKTPVIGPDGDAIPLPALLSRLGVEMRESFAFQNSSFLLILQSVRINPGQESEAGMAEKFHALCACLRTQGDDSRRREDHEQVQLPGYRAAHAAWATTGSGEPPEEPVAPLSRQFRVPDLFASLAGELARFANVRSATGAPPLLSGGESLADCIRIVGRAFQPTLDDHRSDDPDRLRAGLHHGPLTAALGKVNNEIASYLLLADAMTGYQGDIGRRAVAPADRDLIRDLYEAFIEARMQTVSPEVRSQLIGRWLAMSLDEWPDDEAVSNRLSAQIERFSGQIPYREDKARALIEAVDDPAFARMPRRARQAVIDGLFSGLDIASKLDVTRALLHAGEFDKGAACVEDLQRTLAAIKDGSYQAPRPDRMGAGAPSPADRLLPPEIGRLEEVIHDMWAWLP